MVAIQLVDQIAEQRQYNARSDRIARSHFVSARFKVITRIEFWFRKGHPLIGAWVENFSPWFVLIRRRRIERIWEDVHLPKERDDSGVNFGGSQTRPLPQIV
ncbi:hypothetical protein CRG98_043106 [Punica granatum]|uniref:Uncharacterized protein n=1 Tax=Punica granatum TaxID=22663 RepID=A0A2I0HYA4_PUNGR|nr:hypothetical protein CRG98_043106 [Punica granatum]